MHKQGCSSCCVDFHDVPPHKPVFRECFDFCNHGPSLSYRPSRVSRLSFLSRGIERYRAHSRCSAFKLNLPLRSRRRHVTVVVRYLLGASPPESHLQYLRSRRRHVSAVVRYLGTCPPESCPQYLRGVYLAVDTLQRDARGKSVRRSSACTHFHGQLSTLQQGVRECALDST